MSAMKEGIEALAEKWFEKQDTLIINPLSVFIAGYNAANEWVKCSEQLPEDKNNVLIFRSLGWHQVGYWDDEKNYWVSEGFTYVSKVTHWRPLPEKPIT